MCTEYGSDGGFAFFSGEKPILVGGNIKIDVTKRTKRKVQNTITIPIFNELAKFAKEEFWINFLQNASKGHLPKRYKFSNNHLMYKYHSTDGILDMTPVTRSAEKKQLLENLKVFLKKYSSIAPPEEETATRDLNKLLATPEELKWSKIKMSPPKLNAAIASYVSPIKEKNNLTFADFEILFNAVKSFIVSNTFNKKAFIYKNGVLEKIEGLRYDPKAKKFVIEFFSQPKEVKFNMDNKIDNDDTMTNFSVSSLEKAPNKISFLNIWTTYLQKI